MLSPNGLFVSTTASRDGQRGFTAISINDSTEIGRLSWTAPNASSAASPAGAAFSQSDTILKIKVQGSKKLAEKTITAGEHFAVCEPTMAYDIMVCHARTLSLDWAVKLAPNAVPAQVLLLNATSMLVLLADGSCLVANKPADTKIKTSILAEGEQVVPSAVGGSGCDVGSLTGSLAALFHPYIDSKPTMVLAPTKGDDKIASMEIKEINASGTHLLVLTEGGAIKYATLSASKLSVAAKASSSAAASSSKLIRCSVPCPYWIAAASTAVPKGKAPCGLGHIVRVGSKPSAPVAVEVAWSALQEAIKATEAIRSVTVTSCDLMSKNMACIGVVATTGSTTSCALLVYATFFEGDSGLVVETSVAVASTNDAQHAAVVCTRFDPESSIHTLVREMKVEGGATEMAICHASTLHGAPRGRLHWQAAASLGGSEDEAAITFHFPLLTLDGSVPQTIAVTSSVARQTDAVSRWPNCVLGFVQLVRQSVDSASIERLLLPFHPALVRNGLRKAGSSSRSAASPFSVSTLFSLVVRKLEETSSCQKRNGSASFLDVCGGAMEIATQLLTLQHQLGDRVSQTDLATFVALLRSVRPLGLESLSSASRLSMVLRSAEAQLRQEEEEKQIQEERNDISNKTTTSTVQKAKRRAARNQLLHNKIAPAGAGEVAEAVKAHSVGFEAELAKMDSLLVAPPSTSPRVLFMGSGSRQHDTAQDRYEAAIGGK